MALAQRRSGTQFDPAVAAVLCEDPAAILDGLDAIGTWDAVIAAEPALAVMLSGERFDAALLAIANFVDLKSPYTSGHSGAVADLRGGGGPTARAAGAGGARRSAGPGWCTTSAASASRTRSGTSAGRSAPANGSGSGCTPTSPSACCTAPTRSRRWARSRSSTASAWTARATRAGCRARRSRGPRGSSAPPNAYQAMREPRPHRPPRSAGDAAQQLHADVAAGRLDARGGRRGACPRSAMPCRVAARARRA